MSYSQGTLVQQVRYMLNDTPAADALTGSYTAGGLTLTVADATIYDKGDILEFKTDGDTFLVSSAAGTTITMIAAGLGWDGATNANHSSGAVFFLRPAFRYLQIIEAINATILELWPYAWKAVTDTITPVAGTKYYDAATSTTAGMDIIDGIQKNASGTGVDYYGTFKGRPLEHIRGLPTALAASGVGYYIPSFANYVNTLAVRVRARLTTTTSGSPASYDDLTGGSMTDAIVYGACARLVENSDIARVSQSDVTMGEATVQPGSRVRTGAYFHQRFLEKREMCKRELELIAPRQPRWR